MSFSRDNVLYKSLPVNKQRSYTTMNTNQSLLQPQTNNIQSKPIINTEEFAKLDALLQDLLAEVDQPLLLNQTTRTIPKSQSSNRANVDEIEQSVGWLNEQKEILRSRKELNNKAKLNFFNSNSANTNKYSNEQNFNNTLNTNTIVNNKPPVSPNNRSIYSPTQIQQPQQQTQNISTSFRSLSTNPVSMKNFTETDDELNLIDSEADRYSVKSHKSTMSSTIQRSKYHVVSNDFTDATRPAAPTPVPSLQKNYPKRALSAPPVDMGKVVLQRMELKSPLTVRQQSVVPFEQQQQQVYPNEQIIQQKRVQTPINYNTYSNRNNQFVSNQQVPARSVFLNRAYSETPRAAYSNGYETDSGIVTNNNGNVYRNGVNQHNDAYNTYRAGEAANYRYSNTGAINKTYRTLGPNTRYQVVNDQNGYETDSGLVKLKQVLDNRRTPSTIPIQTNRSVTPSFNYHYNQLTPQQQQSFYVRPETRASSALGEPRYTSQNRYGSQYVDQSMDQNIDLIDANMRGYVTSDGRQIILNDSNQSQIINQSQPQSSIIIQQTVAPSAQYNTSQSAFNLSINNQRDTPSRNGLTTSASNSNIQKTVLTEDLPRSSSTSLANTDEVIRDHPKSVKAVQSYWYKPKISREEAISLLKDKQPGTFLIRDSNNFPGAYGLALKVDKPPQNVQLKPGADPSSELVRHFLIEPTTKGVRIKGCVNEPIFGSLAALVHQHSLTPLALPTKLLIPTQDLTLKTIEQTKSKSNTSVPDSRHLLEKGAACNVYYLNSVNVGHKNGFEAITYALNHTKAFLNKDSTQLLLIQFKVASIGITLTDINKKKFIRQHYPTNTVLYCAVDEKLVWPKQLDKIQKPRIFGVVCKPKIDSGHNECHLFVELDPDQPAIAITLFNINGHKH
ncbi:unnamed protein product [Brachionus calyciflorus]|uniref:SH2 domain-containing protein n=1 Tax=Brachionus calyciflorus TaxID=104777 RepID=A0A813Z743_9BILA|nr:unnamed protein product [Brachionus calyciflorus]